MSEPAPKLPCPDCGRALIEAQGRGRFDNNGEYIEHRHGCRCRWCQWMWMDDQKQRCECGSLVRVHVDEPHAYARTVEEYAQSEGEG